MHHEFLLGFFSSGLQFLFFAGLFKAGLIQMANLKIKFFRIINTKQPREADERDFYDNRVDVQSA